MRNIVIRAFRRFPFVCTLTVALAALAVLFAWMHAVHVFWEWLLGDAGFFGPFSTGALLPAFAIAFVLDLKRIYP